MTNLIRDFEWSWTGVTVRKTGARVPFDAAHLSEIFHWCVYFVSVVLSPRRKDGPVIGFAPDPARPWYLIWPSLFLAGGRSARVGETPQLWMHFEDRTQSEPVSLPDDGVPRWNFDAHDLSKSVSQQPLMRPLAMGWRLIRANMRGSLSKRVKIMAFMTDVSSLRPVSQSPAKSIKSSLIIAALTA